MPSLMKRICAVSVVALGMTTASAATITNEDGTFDPFGGFDWNSAGSSMTVGSIVDGGTVTTFYMANAVSIKAEDGTSFFTPQLDPNGVAPGGSYEYTVFATITEEVDCTNCAVEADFTATGGTWSIFYDTEPNANLMTGAGITDGTLILQGTISPGFAGTFTNEECVPGNGGGGSGDFRFSGTVTLTNNTFVNPDLTGTTAASTLQIGDCTTSWTAPISFAAAGGGTQQLQGIVLQADANQDFEAVPEPGTLLLLGGALGLLGFGLRRRVA